jgi:Fe-Mn family superoxide dismutase
MIFELPKLPFEADALEPVISKKTIDFHYGKHHQTYVTKLNNLIQGTEFENKSLRDIIKEADGAIFNNGAQVWNHTFYFEAFAPGGSDSPEGELGEAINKRFGGFTEFKDEFVKSATGLFGSGWTWLVKNKSGELEIVNEANAGNPLRSGMKPLMTMDVWEHAYYLDYQNKRPEYAEQFWKIVNWDIVADRFSKA